MEVDNNMTRSVAISDVWLILFFKNLKGGATSEFLAQMEG